MSRSALIIWGGWEGHEPEPVAGYLAAMLREDGFDVRVTPDVEELGASDIGRYSLVVPAVTNGTIDNAAADALTAAVRAGTGLAGHHFCIATSFRNSVRFNYLVGVQWVAHPGDIIDFRVEITRPDDPLVAGIDSFDYRSEQYYVHYDPTVEILSTTTFTGEHDPATTGAVMPVVFKRRFGEGRIFWSALGHLLGEFDRYPQAATILRRGLNWAARSE